MQNYKAHGLVCNSLKGSSMILQYYIKTVIIRMYSMDVETIVYVRANFIGDVIVPCNLASIIALLVGHPY